MSGFLAAVWAIGPTICVGLIFWFVMRAIIRADRSERAALAKIEAEEDARLAAQLQSGVDPRGSARS